MLAEQNILAPSRSSLTHCDVSGGANCICKEGEHHDRFICALGFAVGARNCDELRAILEASRTFPNALQHNKLNVLPPCHTCGVKMTVRAFAVGHSVQHADCRFKHAHLTRWLPMFIKFVVHPSNIDLI